MENHTNQYPRTQMLIKNEFTNPGVDTTVFQPHICRSSSVSKAKVNSVPTSVILEKGCWKRESTFKKIYYKDIINNKTQGRGRVHSKKFIIKT